MRVKSLREQSSAEYAISLTSWLLGPNTVLKQLEAVEKEEKDEMVLDEFKDCQEDFTCVKNWKTDFDWDSGDC